MKYIITISLIITFFSSGIRAQEVPLDTLVDMEFNKIPIKEVLLEISEQYGIRFSYSDSKIPTDLLIEARYQDSKLVDMLQDMFHKNNISFNVIGNQIVLFPFNSNQAIIIKGRVTDAETNTPIPFAHISLSGTPKGTSSNEDGEFELSLTKLPSELILSHLAYEKKLVYIYDDSEELHIHLQPAQTTLKGLTVQAKRNKNAEYQLVKNAYKQLSSSMDETKYGKAFYRQKSRRESEFTEIFELFYDIKYSNNGIEDWALQEGRYAFQNEHEYDIFLYNKNFTLLSRVFSIAQPATDSYVIPINHEVKQLFDLELKEVLKFDERFIAIISYSPKPEIETPAATGELYIDIDSYQILKMKGSFTDSSLGIIGFADPNSSWANYQLDFQISFIDDQSDNLLLDYIQIDHNFDYSFKNKSVGEIHTSSLLSFYEHYTPANNKKLGGPINFKTSDMDMIDGIGYNLVFWSQNPIVKRTPLEEDLIRDFERNEAFGMVFMNNEEEVVLLPDKKYSEKARSIIAAYESQFGKSQNQRLFLRFDRPTYLPGEYLNFTGYVLDKSSLQPFAFGSVLTIEVQDSNNQKVISKKFDLHEGIAFGDLKIPDDLPLGRYHLFASTNLPDEALFEKELSISKRNFFSGKQSIEFENRDAANLNVDFSPEGGILLEGTKAHMVFSVHTSTNQRVESNWLLVDSLGSVLKEANTNILGLGSITFIPKKDTKYFLKSRDTNSNQKWQLPDAISHGVSIEIDVEKQRSIQVQLNQRPALPREVYILSTSNGKVYSFYEKKLNSLSTTFDLPLQHLPGGKNTLVVMDQYSNILCKRSFFVTPDNLNIVLQSASWKSKRSNRVQLKFKISDPNGAPLMSNLSVVCSSEDPTKCTTCDIRNHLLFGTDHELENVDLSLETDSVATLIDNVMIAKDSYKGDHDPLVNSGALSYNSRSSSNGKNQIENEIIAEVNISGNFNPSSSTKSKKALKTTNLKNSEKDVYWIPVLEIDEQGVATIDYKLNSKNEKFYVNIQGISETGLICNQNFCIEPEMIGNRLVE